MVKVPMYYSDSLFHSNLTGTRFPCRSAADYERLEQECEQHKERADAEQEAYDGLNRMLCTVKEERDSFQRVGICAMEERDAALKQADGLKVERTDLLDRNVELRCLLTKQTKRTDEARQLLAQCQERLDPHRDAVLWGDVVEALRAKT